MIAFWSASCNDICVAQTLKDSLTDVLIVMNVSCIHFTVSFSVQDPIERCPAVLVKRYDITQQKALELQLARQQVDLQR